MSHFENNTERVNKAVAIYNGQFYTKSAKKDAMYHLNEAYSDLSGYARRCFRNNLKEKFGDEYRYYGEAETTLRESLPSDDVPSDLHNVREAKHAEFFTAFGDVWGMIKNLVELRAFF